MNTITVLEKQAIKAAQEQRWAEAVTFNSQILKEVPTDISSLNRLGFCYLQQKHPTKAKAVYMSVLKIDPYNPIALKYIKTKSINQTVAPALALADFIEEPGKTKTIPLCRVADQKTLERTPIATKVELVIKNHGIAIETLDGTYLGTLPDDISFRLKKFIQGGNKYESIVKSLGKNQCSIFIKEVKKCKKFEYVASFPSSVNAHISTVHENLLIQDRRDGPFSDQRSDEDAPSPEEENESIE